MQLQFKKNEGNVLFATLFTTGIICLFLGGYLNMVRSENQLTSRSQTWNLAIPIAEAGIEEAMSQLALPVNFPNVNANNGWQWDGTGKYLMKEGKIGDTEYYKVGIFPPTGPGTTPVIVSEGFAKLPLSSKFVSRIVRVNTRFKGYDMPGMIVVKRANANGNKIYIDSFNSATNAMSTGGKYVVEKRNDNGFLATLSNEATSIDLGNADIYGTIASAPSLIPGALPILKDNATVGDAEFHESGSTGIQTNAYHDDVNITVETITVPYSGGSDIPAGPGGKMGPDWILQDKGEYKTASLTGTVLVTGNAKLVITKEFNVKSLTVQAGASLEVYVDAPTVDLSGNGQLNLNGIAANFKYFGLPGNKTLTIGGNGELTAMIYAPNTDLILRGGGSGANDFSGASLTKTVTMNGNYNFHYDENTANVFQKKYIASTWDELTDKRASSWEAIKTAQLTLKQIKEVE